LAKNGRPVKVKFHLPHFTGATSYNVFPQQGTLKPEIAYPCCLGNERLTVSEKVRDLGVVVDSHLCFSEHIANIVRKAHQRANLIHWCFISKNPDLLVKAFKVYVRPILEFNSPVLSPSLSKGILLIESVQRKFTKRIPSMSGLT